MKKIVILHDIEQFYRFSKNNANSLQDPSLKILAFNIDVRILLNSKKISYIIPEKYITEEIADEIDSRADFLNKNWHKNRFKFKGFSLGAMYEREMYYYFNRSLKYLQIFLSLIEDENPTEIYTFKDVNIYISEINEHLEYICSIGNVKLTYYPKKINDFRPSITEVILSRRPSQIFLQIRRNFILNLKVLILRLFSEISKKKKVLMYRKKYHRSVFDECSRKYNLTLLDDKPITSARKITNILTKNRGFIFRFFEDFQTYKIRKRTDLYFKRIIPQWKIISKNLSFQDCFKYKDISLWPVFKKRLAREIYIVFKRRIMYILMCHRLLTKEKYDLVVFDNDVRERQMILSLMASKLNIPTLVIQHSVTSHISNFLPTYAKKFAVWGNISKNFLEKNGIDNERMVITGVPRFDFYFKKTQNEREIKQLRKKIFSDFKINPTSKLILFATSFGHYYKTLAGLDNNHFDFEQMYHSTINAMKYLKGVHLIIKLHPSDQTNGLIAKQIIQDIKIKNILIIKNYSFEDLVTSCDCFITTGNNSSTVLEAMFLNKPIVILNFSKNTKRFPFDEYNLDCVAKNSEEILDKIRKTLEIKPPIEKYQNLLQNYIHKLDGGATKRVLELIENMI